MLKSQIYVVQFVGIILLLCGYFLSDQPDSLSVMHFNASSECQFIKKANRHRDNTETTPTVTSNDNHPVRKSRSPKFISYEVVLPVVSSCAFHPYVDITYDFPLPENYAYLFFEEINPPPPKAC